MQRLRLKDHVLLLCTRQVGDRSTSPVNRCRLSARIVSDVNDVSRAGDFPDLRHDFVFDSVFETFGGDDNSLAGSSNLLMQRMSFREITKCVTGMFKSPDRRLARLVPRRRQLYPRLRIVERFLEPRIRTEVPPLVLVLLPLQQQQRT